MKIYLDMCHGCGQDRGASAYANEETCSDKMINLVLTKLKALGHTVIATRPTGNLSVSDSLNWRCNNANSLGADIFISNHNNAGGGIGAEVYTYNGEKLAEAKRYLEYIVNHGGKIHAYNSKDVNSGIKSGNELAVINGTSMKAILIENFFVDNNEDTNFFNNNIEMYANALVYGITGMDCSTVKNPEYLHRNVVVYQYGSEPDRYCAEFFNLIINDRNEDCICVNEKEYKDGMGRSVYAVGGQLRNKIKANVYLYGLDRYKTAQEVLERLAKI